MYNPQDMVPSYLLAEISAQDFNYVTQPRWRDYEHWMANSSDKVKNVPLYKMGIPGTHDSGTYELFTDEIYDVNDFTGIAPTIAGPIIRAMAVTQQATIYAQLMEGNRYLDLRFAKDSKGRIRIVHTVFGVQATLIFEQIKNFLDSHPKEVVIIDIQNINNLNQSDQARLRDTIKNTIGNHLAPRANFSQKSTLNDFYNGNKNAAILYADRGFVDTEPLYWYRDDSTIQNPWYNTNDFNYMVQKNTEGINNLPANRQYLYVSQMILTINTSEIGNIILNLLKWLPIPIYGQIRFVQEFNKLVSTPGIYNITAPHFQHIQDWIISQSPVDNQSHSGSIFPNIIILDFYQKDNIAAISRYNLYYA